jgi:sugar lactone lactonase YvrE
MSIRFFSLLPLFLWLLHSAAFPLTVQYVRSFGNEIPGGRGLKRPVALSTGAAGNLYVSDAGRNSVLKFSPEGLFLGEAGGPGSGDGRFDLPAGITRRIGFGLFVCDTRNNRLVQMDEDLSILSVFSLDGKTPDNTFSPFAIASSRDGLLYTADPAGGKALVLERDNRIYPFMGKGKAQPLVTLKPRSLAVLTDIYMDDARTGRIYAFDRFGTFLHAFGKDLSVPDCGMAAVNDSLLAVADKNRGEIILFSISGLETGAFKTFDNNGAFPPGAFYADKGRFFILKSDPPAVVVLRVRL